ncbi:MAG: PTS sugar transporter subunit IIC [Desulfovibrio sp.]|nr:PTS sugar transporter subunit IIC [Desulfovibrio sp.]
MLFFFVLVGAARFSCIVGLVERPLALGMIAGCATGHWDLAIALGIAFELVWLDSVAMGGVIPPFAGLAFLLVFPLALALGWSEPGPLLLPMVGAMLAAMLGSLLEQRFRLRQNDVLEAGVTLDEGEEPAQTPERIVKRAIVQRMLWHAGLYLASYAAIALGVALLLSLGLYPAMPDLPWPAVYVLALLGAVLSLRHKGASVLFYLLRAAMAAMLLWHYAK